MMKTLVIQCIVVALVLASVPIATEINAQTWVCGNIDGDPGGGIDLGDLSAFIDYFFISHTPPAQMEAADLDGCTGVDLGDFVAFETYFMCAPFPPYDFDCSTVECPLTPGGSITLDHVEGLHEPGVLRAGIPETHFYLRLTNDGTSHPAIMNGFRLFSPDGAKWSSLTAEVIGPGLENTGYVAYLSGADGQDAGTVGFNAIKLGTCGAPVIEPYFDEVVYRITLGNISPVHEGKTIVLDSSYFPPYGSWKWVWTEAPTWDGPHYFTIVCCVGLTGNVDGDPEDLCDLGDLTKLIDYLFVSFEEPECIREANIDGDAGGLVDLGDLTALIDYLFITFTPPAECL